MASSSSEVDVKLLAAVYQKDGLTYVHYELSSKKAPGFGRISFGPLGYLAKGGYGAVYRCSTQSKYDYQSKGYIYKNKDKVIKVYNLSKSNVTKNKIDKEYQFAKQAGHLGVKKPVYDDENKKAYLIMNRVLGNELYDLIEEDSFEQLTYVQKLELSHKLLLALKNQVTDRGIIHCDIKPENILVQLTPSIQVNIVDYGLAKTVPGDNTSYRGTPAYMAPEIYTSSMICVKSDVYSMARTISCLWLKDYLNFESHLYDSQEAWLQQSILNQSAGELLNLIEHDEPGYANLETLLKKMLLANPKERCTLNEAIDYFTKNVLIDDSTTELADDITSTDSIDSKLVYSSDYDDDSIEESLLLIAQPIVKAVYLKELEPIRKKIDEVYRYADSMRHHHSTYHSLTTLCGRIKFYLNQVKEDKSNLKDIRFNCLHSLNNGNLLRQLAKHKRKRRVAKNTALAVTGLGLGCVVNKAINGRFLFFKNRAEQLVDEAREQLQAIPLSSL